MYQRISVAIDDSAESVHALNVAVTIARRALCPIELVHVVIPRPPDAETGVLDVPTLEELRREAIDSLQRTVTGLEAIGIAATSVVLEGGVPRALGDHLDTSEDDLIVMGTHHRGWLERLLVGSISESVVRHVHRPILLVPADDKTPALGAVPPIHRILLPFDGSPSGEQVIPHVEVLAKLMSADVTLITVVQPVLAAAAMALETAGSTLPSLAELNEEEEEQTGRRVLEHAAAPLRSHGVPVQTQTLSDGRPAHAIVKFAEENHMDVIAMTTHGRGALSRLVSGSTSDAVLHSTRALLLLYRPRVS